MFVYRIYKKIQEMSHTSFLFQLSEEEINWFSKNFIIKMNLFYYTRNNKEKLRNPEADSEIIVLIRAK